MADLSAMLSLLDDPDPAVRGPLVERLGREPALLDRAWTAAVARGDPPEALTVLVLAADADAFIDLYAAAEDLERGAWLLPRLARPRIDHGAVGGPALDALAARLPRDADGDAVARFLCRDCGFGGDQREYHDPRNSYLDEVLARRLGLPIALTVVWILVGRRLGRDLQAVALPGHVLGRWRGGYVDLFAGGAAVSREEIEARARAAGAGGAGPWLTPATDRALLKRMARNLVNAYAQRGDRLRAAVAHGLAAG